MDYEKTIPFDDFLRYKKAKLNTQFPVVVEILQDGGNWAHIESDIQLQNNIKYSDYKLIFMEDLLTCQSYLGHVVMGVNFLKNVRFEEPYLYFTTSDDREVKLS